MTAESNIWNGKADMSWYKEEDTEFIIATAEQLAGLAQLVNDGDNMDGKTFKLGNNIVLNDTNGWEEWGKNSPKNEWISIGNESNKFNGIFDGYGKTVSGVYINVEKDCVGLFGHISWAGIKNVGVVASYIKGREYVGGLVGFSNPDSFIINCHSSANVYGKYCVGGLAGIAYYVFDCHATGNVCDFATLGERVGGLIGRRGGVIGNEGGKGTIANCYATGNVTGSTAVGGLIGYAVDDIDDSVGVICDCYATGEVFGKCEVGGLIGNIDLENIRNCYALGEVESINDNCGGLIGKASESTIKNSYTSNFGFDIVGEEKKGCKVENCCSEGKDESIIEEWDFENSWAQNASNNTEHPYLQPYKATEAQIIDRIKKDLPFDYFKSLSEEEKNEEICFAAAKKFYEIWQSWDEWECEGVEHIPEKIREKINARLKEEIEKEEL